MTAHRTFWPCLLIAVLLALLAGCQPNAQEWYTRGVAAVDRGAWAEAAEAFANAGDFADAPERAAEALALVSDAQTQYEAAQTAMDERRWYDAYAALQRALALDPAHAQAAGALVRVTAELDERCAQAEKALEEDDPAQAATLYAELGDYCDAATRAAAATKLATELAACYERMKRAADDGDWATALTQHQKLTQQAPAYRDVARLRARYLRRAYRAAEAALKNGQQAEALRILDAILASDPAYREAAALVVQARTNAVQELLGVHAYNRKVGADRGWALRLDSVEVRPDGQLLVRATITNATTMRNHLACPQNVADEAPSLYLVAPDGEHVLPTQWACQQWGAQEWDLAGGESMAFWWQYPALYDITAPFSLAFAPWGEVQVSLLTHQP